MPAETRKHSFIRLVIVGFTLCFASQSHSQSVVAPAQDPLTGSRVFGSKGCSKCHAVNGVGAKVGLDLGRIQANRSFNFLGVDHSGEDEGPSATGDVTGESPSW